MSNSLIPSFLMIDVSESLRSHIFSQKTSDSLRKQMANSQPCFRSLVLFCSCLGEFIILYLPLYLSESILFWLFSLVGSCSNLRFCLFLLLATFSLSVFLYLCCPLLSFSGYYLSFYGSLSYWCFYMVFHCFISLLSVLFIILYFTLYTLL